MMDSSAVGTQPWIERRRRAEHLLAREEHAAGLLTLYIALTGAWAEIAQDVSTDPPAPNELADYVATRAMPRVLDRTLIGGPDALREAVVARFHEGDPAAMVRAWLAGDEQPMTDHYLARAATSPVLETVPGLARSTGSQARDARHCPECGGLPAVVPRPLRRGPGDGAAKPRLLPLRPELGVSPDGLCGVRQRRHLEAVDLFRP